MFTGIAGIAGFTGTTAGGGAPAFVPTDLGVKLLAWWDPSDLTTMDKAGPTPVTTSGDAVLTMRDKSGNFHNLVQSVSASRPIYTVDGSGNSYLRFDGSKAMSLTGFSMTLPFDRVMAVQQVAWTSGDCLCGWSGSGIGALTQYPTTPNLLVRDDAATLTGPGDSSLAIGVNGVVTERHISGASQIAINNGSYTTANAGTSNPPNTTFVLGAITGVGASASDIRFYGGVICTGTLTSGEIASLRTYLGNKCGLTL